MRMTKEHSCEVKESKRLYRIGMFASFCRTTVKTLRFYEEQNLLKPEWVDPESGYRYYEASQIADMHQLLALRNMGFSIEELKEIKKGKSEKKLLLQRKQQILKEMAELTGKLMQIESYLAEEGMESGSHVLIKTIPEVIVAYREKRIDSYDELFDCMPEMGAEMERLGCVCAEPDYCFTYYPEPGYKETDVLIEACEAVKEKREDSEMVKFKVMPEIKEAACIFHKGSYDSFHLSYRKLIAFIESNGYEICGGIRESYIDGAWNKDSADEWLSEIQIPICKK